jgi:hypothetical protein
MPLSEQQRWHAAQFLLDVSREHGVASYTSRITGKAVFEFPASLAPSLKEQFEREFVKFAPELKELLRP